MQVTYCQPVVRRLAFDAGELPPSSRVPPGAGSGPAPALSELSVLCWMCARVAPPSRGWTAPGLRASFWAQPNRNLMNYKSLPLAGLLVFGAAWLAQADGMQRIGHTTLTPRHSTPDDKGMYAALIDPTNGYAYFVGAYLFKLDIRGNLPVQAGPALYTGQSTQGAINPAAGYLYLAKNTVTRYALGAGTNADGKSV